MSKLLVLANEGTAAQRRVYFHLVDATDGITAETGEAGGQPQVSSDGGAWTNTGIGTLSAIGNGRYYADLTQTLVQTAGTQIETRYKSANTAECPGDSVQVVAFDPNDTVRLGLTALPNAAADAAGGLPISDAGGLDLDAKIGALTYGTANRVNVQVYGMEANVMTAAAAASDLTTELQSGLATAAALATAQTSIDDIPTNAELATALAAADDSVLAAIAALNNLSQANIRTAVGLASANLDTQIATLATAANLSTVAGYIDTEIATIITNLATVASYIDTEIAALTTAVADVPTNAELATALAAADDAVLAAIAALNNLSSAQAQTAANDAMVALHLDHLLAADYNPASKPGVSTALLNELVESDGGVSRFTANALEQAPAGGGGGIGDTYILAPVFSEFVPRVQEFNATLYVGDTAPVTLVIYTVDPDTGVRTATDLTPFASLYLRIEDPRHGEVQTVENADLTIDGSSNNELTFSPSAATVASERQLKAALRTDDTEDQVIAIGTFTIKYAPRAA